jgi:methylenetetrahydrofolate dehydrogenase (NADP+)/methenyltetrahydrofolate cyclohydrolase
MSKIIDCVSIAQKVKEEVKQEVSTMEHAPCLTVVIVGDDPASQVYVRNKEKVCEEVGIKSVVHRLPSDSTQTMVEGVVKALNHDHNIHGILVQLPLPKHLDEQRIIDCIDPRKDVDGLTVHNQGLLALGRLSEAVLPCTPSGVIRIFDEIGYDLAGKDVVIVGRSNLFGKPMAQLCLNRNATVTMCHSKTQALKHVTALSDVAICAIGAPKFFDENFFRNNDVVIDVGINRDENGKLCGDVDLHAVLEEVGAITPVPRGVGVLTTAMLLKNVLKCSKLLGNK